MRPARHQFHSFKELSRSFGGLLRAPGRPGLALRVTSRVSVGRSASSAGAEGDQGGNAATPRSRRLRYKVGRSSGNPNAPGASSDGQPRPSDLLDGVSAASTSSPQPGSLRPCDLLDDDNAVTSVSGLETSSEVEVPGAEKGTYWQELINNTEQADLPRARSASDASSLRRKGHLKEQDQFIEYILDMHRTHTCEEVMLKMDRWIMEHKQDPLRSKLKQLVPCIGAFFTDLDLMTAFREYDEFFAISRRKHIGPNFAEIRHVLNIAQVHGSAEDLKLITFDADGTLYADGHHLQTDNAMIDHMIALMRSGIQVAIVTAAGYPGHPEKFEMRVQGLLDEFKRLNLPASITDRFHILGGECNYLVRVVPDTYRLEFVPDVEWKNEEMLSWSEEDINELLDRAEELIRGAASRLRLPVKILRKERAVGAIPMAPTIYEVLEDLAITVQISLIDSKIPYCAFNGGNDVFVDVGNKNHGLMALQRFVGAEAHEVLHVGDRFTQSGNDAATRDCCSIMWVANPEETAFFMKTLLNDLRKFRSDSYVE